MTFLNSSIPSHTNSTMPHMYASCIIIPTDCCFVVHRCGWNRAMHFSTNKETNKTKLAIDHTIGSAVRRPSKIVIHPRGSCPQCAQYMLTNAKTVCASRLPHQRAPNAARKIQNINIPLPPLWDGRSNLKDEESWTPPSAGACSVRTVLKTSAQTSMRAKFLLCYMYMLVCTVVRCVQCVWYIRLALCIFGLLLSRPSTCCTSPSIRRPV